MSHELVFWGGREPQDSGGTPQSVQDARMDDDASLVGRPEGYPLTGDDSVREFGDEKDT